MCGKSGGERIIHKPALRVCDRGGGSMTSGKVPAKAFAVFAVALMFAVVFVPLISNWTNYEVDADTGRSSITYHYNKPENSTGSESSVTVDYDGVVSAEYNPNYWQSDNGKNNWDSPISAYVLEALNGEQGNVGRIEIELSNIVDGYQFKLPDELSIKVTADHWRNAVKIESLGDNLFKIKDERTEPVISCKLTIEFSGQFNFEYLFGGWSKTPQPVDGVVDYYPGEIVHQDDNVTNLYAVWLTPSVYYLQKQTLSTVIDPCVGNFRMFGHESDYVKIQNATIDSEYTNIYTVSGETKMGDYLKTGTYRSVEGGNGVFIIQETWNNGRDHDYHIPLIGNVILDNITLKSGTSASNHGSDSDHGLFADGHRLIIGTNVSTISDDSSNPMSYPQIFGGRASNTYKDHTNEVGTTNPSSTDVVIFSGTYYNVVAGNYDVSMSGDTHLVIRGKTTVLDTVVGGNSAKVEGISVLNTWIYILGGCLPADSYQEGQLGTSGNTNGVTLTESTILTGGCNNGRVTGSTNVFISGDADLWDVQGAGRRGMSSVGTANVEVSGQAVIRHVLCGSITDGLDGSKDNGSPSGMGSYDGSVKNVNIMVKDAAAVGSVFGAGYDTYYHPYYASMLNGGTISITMEGGTVGYLYGGGYRGAIGYSGDLRYGGSEKPIDSISISITGGKVLGDVFGGGRGGVDKVLHSGTVGGLGDEGGIGSQAIDDSTGFAWTCADEISISITGGSIGGSVYGGGESVFGVSGKTANEDVAKVVADNITIDVSGGSVSGSVFGAGKGLDLGLLNSINIDTKSVFGTLAITYETDDLGYRSVEGITPIEWYAGSFSLKSDDDGNGNKIYTGYAQVGSSPNAPLHRPGITIAISGDSIVGDGSSAVYGAGRLARTYADSITIELGNGEKSVPTLKGSVYGGGLGVLGSFSVESVREITLNNATVNGSIFGGSRNGNDGNVGYTPDSNMKAEINLIAGTVTQNVYGGGFQGQSVYHVIIRFGTPAVDYVQPVDYPYPIGLTVDSIYSGGYFNPTLSQSGDTENVLVKGDVEIMIGSRPGSYNFEGYGNIGNSPAGEYIAILGDVFGEGSFSGIGGRSSIEFCDYVQTSDKESQMMGSVQLADHLEIHDSSIALSGSSAGDSQTITEMMTLNDIVNMEMYGHSELTLYAEMNEIGAYSSYSGDDYATPADFTSSCSNTIRLMDGSIAQILGRGNDGENKGEDDLVGEVSGFTIIDNVSDRYYGAFAMGSASTDDDVGGFLISNGDGTYSRAPTIVEGVVKIWYISGATSIDRVLTFNSDYNYGSSLELIVPTISTDSVLYYSGAYIDYIIQDSMYVANEEDFTKGSNYLESGNYFGMSVGDLSVATHVFNGTGWQTASPQSKELDGASLDITSKLLGSDKGNIPSMYGLLGYVVVHIVESYKYGTGDDAVQVPIHTINLVIGIYVEPDKTRTIDVMVTLIESEDGLFTGTGYVPLPAEGNMYTYGLRGFTSDDIEKDCIGLQADSTIGRNGWIASQYSGTSYKLSEYKDGETVSFGSGGVVGPVIRLDYSGDEVADGSTLIFNIALAQIDGDGTESYDVVVTFKCASDVGIHLEYTELTAGDDGSIDRFVLSYTDGSISWRVASDDIDIGYSIPVRFGAVITDYDRYSATVDGKLYNKLSDILDALIDAIPSTTINDEKFVYSKNFVGWFSDSSMINMFDLGSPVSQDIVLYAKFGVSVTFNFGNGTAPYQTVIGFGQSLQDHGMFNLGENADATKIFGYEYLSGSKDYVGHMLLSTNGWVASVKDPSNKFDFSKDLTKNLDLYLVWDVETYVLDITVKNESSQQFESKHMTVSNSIPDSADSKLFNVEYGKGVTITLKDPFHIGSTSATGTYAENMILNFIGATSSTKTLSFNVPDAGDDISVRDSGDNPGTIKITITVTDKFDVTISMVTDDGFEFTSDLGKGDSLSATSGDKKANVTSDSPGELTNLSSGSEVIVTATADSSAGYTFELSVWVNGQLVEERVTSYTMTLGSDVINPEIQVALHRTVEITNNPDWETAHITGITLYKVKSPSTPNGAWDYYYTPEWIPASYFDNGSKLVVHQHDSFVISSDSGWMIEDEEQYPTNVTAVIHENTPYFEVTGDGDVSMRILEAVKKALSIGIKFMTPDGQEKASEEQINTLLSGMGDAIISVKFNGDVHTITVSKALDGDEGSVLKFNYPTGGKNIPYSATLGGFEYVDGTFNDGPDSLTIEMTPIGYTIRFQYLDEDGNNGKTAEVGWNVYEGNGIPVPEKFVTAEDVHGKKVMVKTLDGTTPVKFIDEIVWSEFDTSNLLRICAVVPPHAILDESVMDGSVIVTVSDVRSGSVDPGRVLFGGVDVTFVIGDGATVSYDSVSGILSFEGMEDAGTGTMKLRSSDGHMLTIYIVADPEGM